MNQVPEGYIRKQTLTNCERYITQELKDLEDQVLGAKERLTALEYQIFTQLREFLAAQAARVQWQCRRRGSGGCALFPCQRCRPAGLLPPGDYPGPGDLHYRRAATRW